MATTTMHRITPQSDSMMLSNYDTAVASEGEQLESAIQRSRRASLSTSESEKDVQAPLSQHRHTLNSLPESLGTPTAPGNRLSTVPAPPNGGVIAWLQVLGSWMLFFNTWGILNTFGIYQTYYESGSLFHETSSNVSWIGAIQSFFVLIVGVFAGPVYDRGNFRALLLVGTFGVVFGHMILSLCHEFWQVLIAQGVVIGLGAGCLFTPAVAIMPAYFSTRIGLAIGLAASGSSTGGIVYPITFYRLIDQIGFGWCVRVLGFMALATLMIPLSVMKMRSQPSKAREMIDWSAFQDMTYMTFSFGAMLGLIGLYVALFYISFFGQQRRITDDAMSFYLVPILNTGSVVGRTLPNWLSDYTGALNIIIPGAIITGALILTLMAVSTSAPLVIEAVLLGFFSGVYIALPPVIFAQLTTDKHKIGTRMGMGMGIMAFGVLAGGPGGGGILQRKGIENLDWHGTWIFGGVCTLASGVVFAIVRFRMAGLQIKMI